MHDVHIASIPWFWKGLEEDHLIDWIISNYPNVAREYYYSLGGRGMIEISFTLHDKDDADEIVAIMSTFWKFAVFISEQMGTE